MVKSVATASVTLTEWVTETGPLLVVVVPTPVIVMVGVPVGVEAAVESVNVTLPTEAGFDEKAHCAPLGRPAQESDTVPV